MRQGGRSIVCYDFLFKYCTMSNSKYYEDRFFRSIMGY
jgi:hypothetical protein